MAQPFELANQGQVTDPITSHAKAASSWLDEFFAPVGQPLGRLAKGATEALVRPFSPTLAPRAGLGAQQAAEQLPRTFAEAAPWLMRSAPGPLKALSLLDVPLRSFADQPAATSMGSRLTSTALETGAFFAAPKVGEVIGSPIKNWLGRRLASAAGTVGAFEGANWLEAHTKGEPYQPLTPEHIAGTVASVLPWEVGLGWSDYQKTKQARELTQSREDFPKPLPTMPPLSKEDLRPAVRVRDQNLFGQPGDTHAAVLERHGINPKSIPHRDPRRGFIDINDPDNFINRLQAETRSGLKGTAKAGGLDSMDLVDKPPTERPDLEELLPPLQVAQQEVGKPLKIPIQDQPGLKDLEDSGQSAVTIANTVVQSAKLNRGEKENLIDYYLRSFVAPEVDLSQPHDPDTLMRSVEGFLNWKFRDIMGLPEDEVGRLTLMGLRMAAMAGRSVGRTLVLPAEPYVQNNLLRGSSFYVPSRSGLPNAFIGILSGYDKGDREIFETFHALAHEMFHGIDFESKERSASNLFGGQKTVTSDYASVLALKDMVKDMTKHEMAQSIEQTLRTMASPLHQKYLKGRYSYYTEDEQGRTEFLADTFGLFAMGAASPKKERTYKSVDDMIKYGAEAFKDLSKGLLKDWATALSTIKEVAAKLGWKFEYDKLDRLHSNMKALLRSAEETEDVLSAFLFNRATKEARPWAPVSGLSYDKIHKAYRHVNAMPADEQVKQMVQQVSPMVVPQSDRSPTIEGKRLNWLEYFIPLSQLSQNRAEFADMAHLARNVGSLSRELIDKTWSLVANHETGESGTKDIARLAKSSTPLNTAWSKVMLAQNALSGDRAGQRLTQDEVTKFPEYAKLNAKDKAVFDRLRDQVSHIAVWTAKKQYDSFRDKIGFTIARGLMARDLALKWHDAEKLGKSLTGLYLDSDVYAIDPNTATELFGDRNKMQQLIEQYVAQGPNQISAIAEMSKAFTHDSGGNPMPVSDNKTVQKLNAHRRELMGDLVQDPDTKRWSFQGKPGFSPENRVGRWMLLWQKTGEEPMWVQYKQKDLFNKRLEQLNKDKAQGKMVYLRAIDKTDKVNKWGGMTPERFNSYNEAIQTVADFVANRVGTDNPELAKQIKDELMAEIKNEQPLIEAPQMRDRRLIGGRDELNMAEGLVHYIANNAHTIAKRYEEGQHALYLKDPILRDHPQFQEIARNVFNTVMNVPERFNFIRKMIAANYIFFSPSLAFVEGTQQLTNHVPALAMRGMSVSGALKSIWDANFDVANAYLRGKKNRLPYDIYASPEETQTMREYVDKGIAGGNVGWLADSWDLQKDVDFINRRNWFGGNGEIVDRNSLLGNPMYYMYKLGTNIHGIAIEQNQKVAFLSAYRHFRKSGMDVEAAKRQAEEVTVESMHGGGKASRPLWYLGIGPGNPGSSVGSVMYSLQMYVYNTVAQMGRYVYKSIDNNVKDPTERANARRAASFMLASSVLLAGVGGIPISKQLIALLEQLDPQAEPRRYMAEAFYGTGKWLNSKTHLMGRDEDMGQFVMTAAQDGLMNAVGPWNLANRFELGVLMGVDPYRGFQWSNVVGPGGQLLEQILLKPWQAAASGDYEEGLIQAIPNSNIRRLAEFAHNGWDIRNKDARLNVQLDDSEKFLQAAGFTPRRVADFRSLDEMKRRSEHAAALRQKEFHEHVAEQVIQGDFQGASSGLLQHAQTTPNYDPRAGARRVAELVQQKTLPYDPLRQGSRTSQSYAVGRLFDHADLQGRNKVSELDRLLRKQAVTQNLGFPTPLSREEMRVAQLTDQLMQANPRMTRSEALALLARVLRPRSYFYSQALTPLEESVGD